MKRRRLFIIILAMLLCLLFCGIAEAKAPSNKKLKKSYTRYINKKYPSAYRYMLIDLNGDGVKECMVLHNSDYRGSKVSILGYRKKKVICMYDNLGFSYTIRLNKKKKQLCVDATGGAATYQYTILKVKKKKATILHSYKQKEKYIPQSPYYMLKFYKSNDDMTYNRGKEITEKEFRTVEKKILKWKDITHSSKWKKIG